MSARSAEAAAISPDCIGVDCIGVDWGTTNRRGYRVDCASGAVRAEYADADGMLAARGRFPESLAALIARLDPQQPDHPAILAGMVGAAQGWHEAPYLDCAVPLTELPAHCIAIPGTPHRIVPGYCRRLVSTAHDPAQLASGAVLPSAGFLPAGGGTVDVMRGEETQLLGAVLLGHDSGWFALPGTHGKWVKLESGRIVDFATYMTGEWFNLLRRDGTLAAALAEPQEDDPTAFAEGVAAAAEGVALSSLLFAARAAVVSRQAPAHRAAAWVSGVLIGAEWADVRRRQGALPTEVVVIGSPELIARHARVAELVGTRVIPLDGRSAFLAALPALAATRLG